jgi:iron complex outermembrane recepter protein
MFKQSIAICSVTAASVCFSFSNIAIASDQDVETVYVSATRSEGPQMPVATQISVIDSEQIRLSGATTIGEVLRSQAGVQIQDADGSGGRNVSVALRGFSATGTSNTLILVDGRKLNNPTLAGPALNTIALKDIERVEIIQGSAGVLYGDQAVAGVINVITRKAKQGEVNGSVGAEKGSDDVENFYASVDQGFENGLNYGVSAQKRNADNFRDNNQSASTNVLGNIGFNFSAGKIFVERQNIDDELRLAGPLSNSNALSNPRKTYSPNDFSNQDTELTRIGGEIDLIKNWKLVGEYADRDETGNYFFDDYFNLPGSAFYAPYAVSYNMRVKNFSPRIVGTMPSKNGNTVATFGYDKSDSDYNTQNGFADISQQVDGLYGQVIYPATQRLTVTAGLRHSSVDDTNRRTYDQNFNLTVKNTSLSLNAEEVGLNFQANNAWRVFARYADGFRFANADENNFTLPGIGFLNPQTSESYEAGVAWAEAFASVKYSVYTMKLDNEIMYDPVIVNSNGFGGFGANINLPTSERQGFIFEGNLRLSQQISVRSNYTYTDATLTSGSFNDKHVPFVAENTANVGLVFDIIQHITLVFDANYTGSRYAVGDNENTAEQVDPLRLFNASILWAVSDIEFSLRVKNITSEQYSDYAGLYGQYPQAERSYNAHLGYRF